MAEAAGARLPLTILGGYLGAGKSTWLRHQLHVGRYAAAHVLVNEAAGAPVDHLLLGRARRLTPLPGGCCCCEGSAQLVAALRALCEEQVRHGGARSDHVVLETSGLADPGAIARIVAADPLLVRRLAVREVVVLADAENAVVQLAEDPLGLRQIETADRIVLTKVDRVGPDTLARLVATLRRINPAAPVSGSVLGEERPLPQPPDAVPFALPVAPDDIVPIRPSKLDIGPGSNWDLLSVWLSALLHARGDRIVRVKGVIRTPAGRLLLQSVRRSMQPPEILPETAEDRSVDNVLIFLGRDLDSRLLARSLQAVADSDLTRRAI